MGRSRRKRSQSKEDDSELPTTATSLEEPNDAKMSVSETCDLIAELAEGILESPQQAFQGPILEDGKRGKSPMKQLFNIATQTSDSYTSQLATLSLLSVFKDILPAYRIVLPTDQQRAVKVGKDVKKIWDYERDLLQHYQQYLKLLENHWKGSKEDPQPLAVASMLCLTELLQSHYTFNFRSQLLTLVVRHLNHVHPAIHEACVRSVGHVMKSDTQGVVALEATRLVCKLVKDSQFRIRPAVLEVLTQVPLRTHADEAQVAKLASQARKKKRKLDKVEAEISQELDESKATVDTILLARSQSDSLQAILLVYFRILKHENMTRVETLLPATLAGLAKFAHLVNLETVMDLLKVLQTLLSKVDHLPLDAALNAILTAFLTLQGPGKTLNIDPKEYVQPLYSQLPRLIGASPEIVQRCTPIAIKCLDAAFIKRREYSTVRLAAFVRQLWTTSMHLGKAPAIPLLALGRQLLQRYPATHPLLENELDIVASGEAYNATVVDPEHANPMATSGWELSLLKHALDDRLVHQAKASATLQILSLPKEGPERLWNLHRQAGEDLYIPYVRTKKKHPLAARESQDQPLSKKRKPCRFVTPRVKTCSLESFGQHCWSL